jgi:isoleucyl-tRNA synthetase
VWKCDLCPAIEVVGSYRRLFELAGRTPPDDLHDRGQFDPHRPAIDELTWACFACRKDGRDGVFRRVEDVIDAWFDSGAMPFAQHHYLGAPLPQFDPDRDVGRGFPADFIAEAVDQTRGWFYTLHVLATLLFDQVAFENCIVLGHVNDEQGRKMSKRLGNVVDPMGVIEETGADALRWYFCVNDPEQTARFSARLVRDAAQGFLIPLWNALSFFTIYANIDDWRPGASPNPPPAGRPELDRWILLRLDQLVEQVTVQLDAYAVAPAARELQEFLDDLTNWYVRRSRERFWAGNPQSADKEAAYRTLYDVLTTLARLLAPFTPFLAEVLHRHLVRSQSDAAPASVHLEEWPRRRYLDLLDTGLARAMSLAKRIVGLARAARSAHDLKTRQPLAAITLVFAPEALGRGVRQSVERVERLILDEVNAKQIRWAERRTDFVRHEVRPNFRVLGKRLGPLMPKLKAVLEGADGDALAAELEASAAVTLEVEGQAVRLQPEELEVRLSEKPGLATAGDRELLVALDTDITPELRAEGWAREVVSRIQAARKEAGLDYTDRIRVRYRAAGELAEAIASHAAWIRGETLALDLDAAGDGAGMTETPIEGHDFAFAIERDR